MSRNNVCLGMVTLLAVIGYWLAPSGAMAQDRNTLLSENFDGLPLGPNVQEGVGDDDPRDAVWSKTAPPGWTIDDSLMPAGGMTEWRGWSFTDPVWWDEVAGQERSAFTFGTGNVIAVADSDEWDDAAHDPGSFNSFLSTPPIPISGIPANAATLSFDSSWRPEGDQTATITVSFDGGDPIEVFRYDSDNTFDGCCNPELLDVDLNNPAGASEAVVTFGYTEGNNNWWWAIDNLDLVGPNGSVFSEDFEGVELGPNVKEGRSEPAGNVWTDTPPDGWETEVDPDMPGLDDDAVGVREWEGWAFTNKQWWTDAAADQNRSQFTNGQNTVAVADPDEWDDIGGPAGQGKFGAFMRTPAISLEGVEAGSVELTFDSSWRDECCDDGDGTNNQTAAVTVQYDGKPPIEVLRWESDPASPDFKDDSENESVALSLNNPADAGSMVLEFSLTDAGNDWWWAVDNIEISGIGGSGGAVTRLQAGDADQDLDFDQLDLVKVQIAAKYLTGQPATWGDGDWNAAPGGSPGNPPQGDGQFNQLDVIAALSNGLYLTGPYGAISGGDGAEGDEQTSIKYNPSTGEVSVDAPASTELTSINIDSAAGIFTGDAAENLGGSFDNDADNNIFKATFGGSFGSLTFGNVAQPNLSKDFLISDLTVVGSLAGGGDLGSVDLIYVPEPAAFVMLLLGSLGLALAAARSRHRKVG